MNVPVKDERATTRLELLLARRESVVLPGAPSALFAPVIEDLDFEAVYVTGAGIANMSPGVPDIGLVTLTERAEYVAAITDIVGVPVFADADTGFGNPVNMVPPYALERAGAGAMQIEDQVSPKKCGRFNGKDVVPTGEMGQKIKGRTPPRDYPDRGADATFVEAPLSIEDFAQIARTLLAPQFADVASGRPHPGHAAKRAGMHGFRRHSTRQYCRSGGAEVGPRGARLARAAAPSARCAIAFPRSNKGRARCASTCSTKWKPVTPSDSEGSPP